jgi:hypothetical protein
MPKDFGTFLKEIIKERIDEIPCPPKEEVWEYIITHLRAERQKERKKQLMKRCKLAAVICITIAVFATLFVSFQAPVMAFANRIMKKMIVIDDDTIKIYKKVVSPFDENTPDYLFGRDIDDPRIGETQKKIHFRLFIPEYIPKDFQLMKVNMLNKYEERETVTYLYVSNDNKTKCFEILQQNFPADSNETLNIVNGENTQIEILETDNIEYTLICYEENLNGIMWDNDTISCEIHGNISRDEIIKIAKSMK